MVMQKKNVIGQGSPEGFLSEDDVRLLIEDAVETLDIARKRVLIIIPDGTRTAPLALFFRILSDQLYGKVTKLDFLVALGTHPAMDAKSIDRLLGMSSETRARKYPRIHIFNHRWDLENTYTTIGTISPKESLELSHGLLSTRVPVRINRLVLDYDLVVVCGPVFPHEVVGFSGGSKYFSPGISGPEIINFTHWLGALITSYEIIGVKVTPVRDVIERVAKMIPTPKLTINMVVKKDGLAGLYIGETQAAWSAATDLSAQVHIRYMQHPFRKVLSVMPEMYDDLWTGAKGMYKLEPVVAEGGEVIIYAPHIKEVSYTHGKIIDQIGYHVRDYFTHQWERFEHFPWSVLAHSTHLRGIGTYDAGIERSRIDVTLATGIPRQRCEKLNLGYLDPESIEPQEWTGRENEGILLVPDAGEILYRLESSQDRELRMQQALSEK
jgi:nickel-dependent lactate racemase